MSTELTVQESKPPVPSSDQAIDAMVVHGDWAKLTPVQRAGVYNQLCESVGLNPLTRPLDFLVLNGRLTLYANKNCGEQLRRVHRVSVTILCRETKDDIHTVHVRATDGFNRQDESIGSVYLKDRNGKDLKGEDLANAFMKCETKAKRRVSLSLCGLGMLDETEVEDIRDRGRRVQVFKADEVLSGQIDKATEVLESSKDVTRSEVSNLLNLARMRGLAADEVASILGSGPVVDHDQITRDQFNRAWKRIELLHKSE